MSREDQIDHVWMEEVRKEYGHCFGCGRDNPFGLAIDDFTLIDDVVRANFTAKAEHRGFRDMLHGGVVAAALDEVLGWTSILLAGGLAVTAKLEIRYRSPAPPGATYELEGRLVERRGRRLVLEARILSNGATVAEASGLFLMTELLTAP